MKNLFKSMIAGVALFALAGCATGDCSSDPVCLGQQGVTALYQTHTFLDNEAKDLHDKGILVGTAFDTTKADLNTVKKYLDTAYVATDLASQTEAVAQAKAGIVKAETDGNLKETN